MATMWAMLNQIGLDERRATAFVKFAFTYLDDAFARCVMRYTGHLRETAKTA